MDQRTAPMAATNAGHNIVTLQQRLVELQNFVDALTRRLTLQGPVAATWALQGYRDLAITPPDDVVRAACELDDYEARRRWWEDFCAYKSA